MRYLILFSLVLAAKTAPQTQTPNCAELCETLYYNALSTTNDCDWGCDCPITGGIDQQSYYPSNEPPVTKSVSNELITMTKLHNRYMKHIDPTTRYVLTRAKSESASSEDVNENDTTNHKQSSTRELLLDNTDAFTHKFLTDRLDSEIAVHSKKHGNDREAKKLVNIMNKLYADLSDMDLTIEINMKCNKQDEVTNENLNNSAQNRRTYKEDSQENIKNIRKHGEINNKINSSRTHPKGSENNFIKTRPRAAAKTVTKNNKSNEILFKKRVIKIISNPNNDIQRIDNLVSPTTDEEDLEASFHINATELDYNMIPIKDVNLINVAKELTSKENLDNNKYSNLLYIVLVSSILKDKVENIKTSLNPEATSMFDYLTPSTNADYPTNIDSPGPTDGTTDDSKENMNISQTTSKNEQSHNLSLPLLTSLRTMIKKENVSSEIDKPSPNITLLAVPADNINNYPREQIANPSEMKNKLNIILAHTPADASYNSTTTVDNIEHDHFENQLERTLPDLSITDTISTESTLTEDDVEVNKNTYNLRTDWRYETEISNDQITTGDVNDKKYSKPKFKVVSTASNEIHTGGSEVSGSLYFKHGQDLLPAHFIQKSTGNLDIDIEGSILCGDNVKQDTN